MGFLDIRPLFTLGFWFKMVPDQLLPPFQWAFLVFFGLLILAGILADQVHKRRKDNFVLRFGAKYIKNWFLTAGIIGCLLLFFGYERAVFLSSRFWYLVWFISFGLWLYFVIKKIKSLPQKEEDLKKKAQFEKYLPKKK
ncbi:MAG: hypothetical protein WC459_00305 [Patescibacteria group bacterium]